MLRWTLNLCYLAILSIAIPWAVLRWVRTKKRVAQPIAKLTGRLRLVPSDRERIWIHAVSVGEVLQTRPLIDELRRRDPTQPIVLTVSTASGLKVASERFGDVDVAPLPLDFTWANAAAIRRINPSALLLVELELWPNLLLTCCRAGIPVHIVSGRLSEKSFRGYRRVRPLLQPMLRCLTSVDVQTTAYRERFASLGVPESRLRVAGSLKHDNLPTATRDAATLALRDRFGIRAGEIVFVAGSTHASEEQVALNITRGLIDSGQQVRLLLAPRHPERFDEVARLILENGFELTRRTERELLPKPGSVGLLDTIGELALAWKLADVAFVGGSLTDRGGQNMLEPAAAGAATLFGPNVWNFPREVFRLLERQAAVQVENAADLAECVDYLVGHPGERAVLARNASVVVQSLQGAASLAADRVLGRPAEQSTAPNRAA